MSLATRCTSCATVFRVVQDQLKVSEGWVRCGRCDTVFNAVEHLFDLDREALPANAATGERTTHDQLPELASDTEPKPPLADAFGALLRERTAVPGDDLPPPPAGDAKPAQHADLLRDVPGGAAAIVDADGEAAPPPDFVRHAERDARWQRTPVRRALRVACVLLLVLLALQWAQHFRDTLAAHWPAARPLIEAWCGVAGCRIEPLRRIADVTVENTGLVPASAGPGTFLLSVTLRNRGRLPLALPSIDVSLTDSNGQLVTRRAVAPAEFTVAGAPFSATTLLRPDTDTRLQATLATAQRVVGYSVEVFYP